MTITSWLKAQRVWAGRWLSLAVGLGLAGGLLLIAQAWFLAGVVDAVLFSGAGIVEVAPWLWAMLALFPLRAGLAWAAEQAAAEGALGVKRHLRDAFYERLRALGPVRLGGERSGELANTLTDGIEALEAYYARYLPAVALAASLPLAILVFLWPLDWLSGFILLGTAPLIPLFMILVGKGAERLNQRQWRRLARLSAHFLDVIQGLTTLKLFNASRREAEAVARISEEYRRSTMAVLRVAFLSSLTLEFFATVSIAVVAVAIGFRLFWGQMDFRHGFFVLLLAPEFYLPLRNLGSQYHARMAAIGAAERLIDVLQSQGPTRAVEGVPTPDLRQAPIRLLNVHYSYPGGRRALDGLTLAIHPGERIALVGASGAGKSTVFALLLGFIRPDGGQILVGERPLAELDADDLRRHLAWVPQRPRLFHGSLLDNIRLGSPDASPEQVRAAARLGGADAFIEPLPQGYQTQVGEGGHGLSGGEIRRVALARACLRDAPLVLLDEPTASLDAESEREVAAAVETLAVGRTLITIAHRLQTVRRADRILVLDRGRVVEAGPHDELIARDGPYHRLLADRAVLA
ncbi:MAG: thiol reductant ABC exporter subunit CydD [Chromatiaceae bacterium]|nr:thiol reductant ABC exporter subunit CydD [Chromatiaceae bacterium]